MAIDWSFLKDIPGAIEKPRIKALAKADKVKAIEKRDREENAKVKARAGGRCEVGVMTHLGEGGYDAKYQRCKRKGVDPHHLIYGNGLRNRGKSILAEHKLWVCRQCDDDIGAKKLRPTNDSKEAATIRYWRAT